MRVAGLLAGPAGRLLGFTAGAGVWVAASVPAAAFIGGLLGVSRPAAWMALTSGFMAAGLLLLSAWLLRREGASLAALGLPTHARRARELGIGFLISTALFLAVAWTQSAVVDAPWKFQGVQGFAPALAGMVAAASMVLFEELLFRGQGLRYLRALWGDRAAIVLSALLFGAYHLVGASDWGMVAALQFAMSATGGLLFGWATVRSGGLALAIGLHLGGNWVQSSVAGFVPAGGLPDAEESQALWQIPISAGDMQLLAGPDLLMRLPYLAAIAAATMATWMFLRSGRAPESTGW